MAKWRIIPVSVIMVAAFAVVLWGVAAARADTFTIWTFEGATIGGGGGITGSFTYDVNSSAVSSWDITVTLGDISSFPTFQTLKSL